MEKRLILVVAVVLAACPSALAQTSSPVEPTVVPTQTPLPPKELKNHTFTLYNGSSTTEYCLRMTVAIAINITYLNSTGQNVTTFVPLTDHASTGAQSHCNSSAYTAELYVELDNEELAGEVQMDSPVYMVFEFKGDKTQGQWSLGNMTFHVQSSFLDNYNGSTEEYLDFKTNDKLHQDPNANIESSRSYVCNTHQRVNFNTSNSVNPFVGISYLQVQAFSFKNTTGGEFDDPRTCLLDTAGKANKIVPIAVGAALAGLVVVVLIAYLIGRLRSRRQSSYEALS